MVCDFVTLVQSQFKKKKNPTGTQRKHLEILDVTVVVFNTTHHYPSSPLFSLDDTFQANMGENVVCLLFTQC